MTPEDRRINQQRFDEAYVNARITSRGIPRAGSHLSMYIFEGQPETTRSQNPVRVSRIDERGKRCVLRCCEPRNPGTLIGGTQFRSLSMCVFQKVMHDDSHLLSAPHLIANEFRFSFQAGEMSFNRVPQ